jgi:hypothetical protein
MSSNSHDQEKSVAAASSAEKTLRLVASLPAPSGLEERVQKALDRAPRRGSVLAWPRALRPESGWMRSAAAAAIVFVVAGGGWGVYQRVELNQPGKVIVMPTRMPAAGGFTGAGAIRTPVTLPGPKAPAAIPTSAVQPKAPKKRLKPTPKPEPATPGSTNP